MNVLDKQRSVWLVILAAISIGIYWAIRVLSHDFAYVSDVKPVDRPILLVLVLFTAAFVAYLVASVVASRMQSGLTVWLLIFIPAIIFRCMMLWSDPIQEIDIYRYLWDGAVSRSGNSPYAYPPAAVLSSANQQFVNPRLPADLQALAKLANERPGLKVALSRIGYADIRTVYPPISQLVFAFVDALTPENATVETRMNYMRTWLIIFELSTTFLVILLLRFTELSDGWAMFHAWCPLLVKETANSGHLDSIAVFLMIFAIWLTMKMLFSEDDERKFSALRDPGIIWSCLAAIAFSLAIGAKLFPLALVIWFFGACVWRLGLLRSLLPALLLLAATWMILRPVLPDSMALREPDQAVDTANENASESGFSAFLGRWEMNDFFFLLPSENLKDPATIPKNHRAWFVILPESARKSIVDAISVGLKLPKEKVPFFASRFLLAFIFGILAIAFTVRAFRSWDALTWLRTAFLTVAWFWLLCPTQNPWYWSWAVPLLAFSRCKTWWLMSGLVMIYYLRFWLKYHFTGQPVAGTSYEGVVFFDLVVTWLEFVPWLFLLIAEHLRLNWIADQ